MRFERFDFIDENFGEKVECVLIWNDNSFILITIFGDRIKIREYTHINDLFKELITNKNLMEMIKDISIEQEKEISELNKKIKKLKAKLRK